MEGPNKATTLALDQSNAREEERVTHVYTSNAKGTLGHDTLAAQHRYPKDRCHTQIKVEADEPTRSMGPPLHTCILTRLRERTGIRRTREMGWPTSAPAPATFPPLPSHGNQFGEKKGTKNAWSTNEIGASERQHYSAPNLKGHTCADMT